jgi:hypothetical protein
MMNKGRTILLIFSLIFSFKAKGQQFGGLLPSINWKQLNNNNARIIFPSTNSEQAYQVASIVNALSHETVYTIGQKVKKINIIFQNQTTVSNGYVQLAPFRSEFQLTADQNSFELGSLPWAKQLAIHEYRHVQQYNNYRIGLSKIFYYLFGESGQEFANSIAIPNWFWEGDAVFQETLVSRQGRGRLPFFFNGYRALWAGDKDYSWMKLRNGSLRDYVPDHYPLGYMLVAYGREKFGDSIWKPVTNQTASFHGLFYPMQSAIQRNMGISYSRFSENALAFFRDQPELKNTTNPTDSFAKHSKHFAGDQEFPQFINTHQLVYVESSYKKIPRFVILNLENKEKKTIRIRSISLDNYFSYRNGKIVYAAYETNTRWGWSDFSVIRILDLKTGEEEKISAKSKLFAPDISPDGKQVVAVQQDPDGKTSLVLLNTASGKTVKTIRNPQELYFTYPKFVSDSQLVTPFRNDKGEMALGLINLLNENQKQLTPFTMNVIGFPSVFNDSVYFSASQGSTDQIFGFFENKLFKASIPASTAGRNYEFQINQHYATWSTFTAVGYRMNVVPRGQVQWTEILEPDLVQPMADMHISALERGPSDLIDHLGNTSEKIQPYNGAAHLINLYSWRPYITDPEYTFALESQNVLNTLQSELYFTYNRNEQSKQIGFNTLYGAWFPWIDLGVSYTFDRNALFHLQEVFWNEWQAKAGFNIPLYTTKGRTYSQWQVGSDLILNSATLSPRSAEFKDSVNLFGPFLYIDPHLSFVNQSQKAQQQINPSWAQAITLQYDQAITKYHGQQFLASGYFYFPGLAPTNSLVLTAAFQERDSLNQVSYSNAFPFSRGYTVENFYRMVRFGANYHVPLVYPDWGFGNLVYFLRIRANLFFDYTRALNNFNPGYLVWNDYRSLGAELYFDTKWWNQLPVSFGIRYSRLLDPDFLGKSPNQWEFILPLNLLSK